MFLWLKELDAYMSKYIALFNLAQCYSTMIVCTSAPVRTCRSS